MVAGADRELRQRFSRARPLGPRPLEEVARQRRQAHAVGQGPQRPARSRFLHRRRIHRPHLERAPGDDRETLLLEQADTQRVQPTLGFLQALQQRHVRQVRQVRLSGANHRFPQRIVRSRGAAGGSAGGCRPSCPYAAPSTPRWPAPARASPAGGTTAAHPNPRPPCRPPCQASACQDTPATLHNKLAPMGPLPGTGRPRAAPAHRLSRALPHRPRGKVATAGETRGGADDHTGSSAAYLGFV